MKKILPLIAFLSIVAFANAQNLGIIPTPQNVELRSGSFVWDENVVIYLSDPNEENYFTIDQFYLIVTERTNFSNKFVVQKPKLRKNQKMVTFNIVDDIDVPKFKNQAYTIEISDNEIVVSAVSPTGLFYGMQSLKQIFRKSCLEKNDSFVELPCASIIDYPAMQYRGWMDDISRGPIASIDQITKEIEILSEYKMNFFNLYTENVFKLVSYPDLSPFDGLTAEEIAYLCSYAAMYHVELFGNQQCFAHAEKTLQNPFFEDIADTRYNFNPGNENTYSFLENLFDEVANAYSSPMFNINCDETEGLGKGKAKDFVEKVGGPKAYSDHINRVYRILSKYDKKIMMWGDIAVKHPEIINSLPKDLLIVAWSYVASEDFNNLILPFKNSGFNFMIAPGVSMWGSVFPSIKTYIKNIAYFVRDGYNNNTIGMMNTAWDDSGEPLFNSAWHGMIWGAEMSWNPLENTDNILSEKELPKRESIFNKDFTTQFFESIDTSIISTLYDLDKLSNLPIGNMMEFAAMSESVLDFYPSRIDDISLKNNEFVISQLDDVTNKLYDILSNSNIANSEIIECALYATGRISIAANKNLLRIQLFKTLKNTNDANIAKSKEMIESLLNLVYNVKIAYLKLWEKENRSYFRDVNLKKYDDIANELNNIANKVLINVSLGSDGKQTVELRTLFNDKKIYFTVDGRQVDENSTIYDKPFVIEKSSVVKAMTYNDFTEPIMSEKYILCHKGIGHLKKLNSKYSAYRAEYSAGGDNGLMNGVLGSSDYKDGCWQAYWGQDVDVEFDFNRNIEVNNVSMRFLQSAYDWILSPLRVEVYSSSNGKDFDLVKGIDLKPDWQGANKIHSIVVKNLDVKTKYLKVVAKNPGKLPNWHHAAGNDSYLFIDEIVID